MVLARPLMLGLLLLLSAVPTRPLSAEQTRAPRPTVQTAGSLQVATVAEGLEHPWALQFLPDGRYLVTERPGRMRIVGTDGSISEPIRDVPRVFASGQGGLLDVALAPDFATTQRIYFTFAEHRGAGSNGTALARARLVLDGKGGRLENVETIFRQMPSFSGGLHFGSRIAISRDGNLFVTLGERFQRDRAQDLDKHFGKVVRLTPDGKAPADNPFAGKGGALPEIWSYGHRNPQSAAIHPGTGALWTVEHGARGGDEINIPRAGRNYGWPVITYGIDYSGARIGDGTSKDGMEQPVYYWDPSIAPSGMAFYSSDRFAVWRNSLFVGALAGQHLSRLLLDGERVVGEEKLLADLGERIRDVRAGPDGAIYVLTDHPQGKILRLTPR